MTCIVGLRTKFGVLLGADSLASTAYVKKGRIDAKVFKYNAHIAIGFGKYPFEGEARGRDAA